MYHLQTEQEGKQITEMSRCQREIECAEWKQNLNDDKHNRVKNNRRETKESAETLSGSWQVGVDDNASEWSLVSARMNRLVSSHFTSALPSRSALLTHCGFRRFTHQLVIKLRRWVQSGESNPSERDLAVRAERRSGARRIIRWLRCETAGVKLGWMYSSG